MSSPVPDIQPGSWDQIIIKGATWPATTISFTRDGVAVVPVSASFTVHVDGALALTIAATIDGGGIMTIPGLTATQTAAINWGYGNSLLRVTETGSVVTDLLAGNATVVNRAD